jgi:hypothetical protein
VKSDAEPVVHMSERHRSPFASAPPNVEVQQPARRLDSAPR